MPKRFNRNQALNTSFKLEIPGLEEFNYFVQSTSIPGLSMPGVDTPFRNYGTSVPSNRINYDQLNVNLIVDEDFANRNQIQLWMHKYEYGEEHINEVHRDIILHILNSNKIPILHIVFFGSYPVSIGEITLESGTGDTVSLMCNIGFRYQWYEVKKVNE